MKFLLMLLRKAPNSYIRNQGVKKRILKRFILGLEGGAEDVSIDSLFCFP